jgi:hypothetical protein
MSSKIVPPCSTLILEGMLVPQPKPQHVLCNMKVQYSFHKSSLLVPTTQPTSFSLFFKTDCNTVRSESHCALRLRYVDLVVSIEVAVGVCCCFTVFGC